MTLPSRIASYGGLAFIVCGAPVAAQEFDPLHGLRGTVDPAAPAREVTFQLVSGYGGPSGFDDGVLLLPDERGVMGGASASLAFRLGPFSLGPELALLGGSPGLLAFSGVTRFDLARSRIDTPYVTVGIGAYAWGGPASARDRLLTLSTGFGLTFAEGRWRAEARWHPVVHVPDTGGEATLLTIGVGRRFVW